MGLFDRRMTRNCIIHSLSSIIIHYLLTETESLQQEDQAAKENRQPVIINQLAAFLWRSLADFKILYSTFFHLFKIHYYFIVFQ